MRHPTNACNLTHRTMRKPRAQVCSVRRCRHRHAAACPHGSTLWGFVQPTQHSRVQGCMPPAVVYQPMVPQPWWYDSSAQPAHTLAWCATICAASGADADMPTRAGVRSLCRGVPIGVVLPQWQAGGTAMMCLQAEQLASRSGSGGCSKHERLCCTSCACECPGHRLHAAQRRCSHQGN